MSEPPKLLSPVRLGSLQVKNRIMMPAIENLLNHADGSVSQALIDYYAARARGGVGIIILQNSCVDAHASRSMYCQLKLSDGHMIAGLSRLVEAVHEHGSKIVVQIGHGGRQSNPDALPPGVQQVAPSSIASGFYGIEPRELTEVEIGQIQDAFAQAALRAQKAGADGVEIHGAHGYLIHQFLSPLSNQRIDQYGGSPENRVRFACELIGKVRELVGGEFVVGLRLSGDEFLPGGLTVAESAENARLIADSGLLDYLSVSAGVYESAPAMYPVMYAGRGSNAPLAAKLKEALPDMPVVAVGGLDSRTGEQVLQEGAADLVAIGRGLIADPELPNKLTENRAQDIRPCIMCNEVCLGNIILGRPMGCAVNPACGKESKDSLVPVGNPKNVLVIGGGVAGMEAARVAAIKGHKVTLLEKGARLGGHLIAASASPFKTQLRELLDWSIAQVEHRDIDIRLNTEATPEQVKALKPDALIVAVGSKWSQPFTGDVVCTGQEILLEERHPGNNVVIVGAGANGAELALDVAAMHNKKSTIVEMQELVMGDMEMTHKAVLADLLEKQGIDILTGVSVKEVGNGVVHCQDRAGEERVLEADTVALCTGLSPRKSLADSFQGLAPQVHCIGDCVSPRKVYQAVHEGYQAAIKL